MLVIAQHGMKLNQNVKGLKIDLPPILRSSVDQCLVELALPNLPVSCHFYNNEEVVLLQVTLN